MKRILLIEDHAAHRKMLANVLKKNNFEVVEATNGLEGLELYHQEPCDLVITDICMPEKDGNDVIVELKSQFSDVRIIAISGGGFFQGEMVLDVAKANGVNFSLQKPIKIKELIAKVNELLV